MDECYKKLKNKYILCFGTGQWNRTPSVPEHTMSILMQQNKILYVEPLISIVSFFLKYVRREKYLKIRYGIRKENKNLYVYSPPPIGLPFQIRFSFILQFNVLLLSWLVKITMRKIELDKPILWIYNYYLDNLIGRFSEEISIYDCIDQDESLCNSHRLRRTVQDLESKLCKKADIVFVITPELYDKKKLFNPATFVVHAGANYDHYIKATYERTQTPCELLSLKHPILGYMGQIDPWKIDVQLLVYLAHKHPEWSIILMGFPYKGFEDRPLKKYDNIHMIGPKIYEQIPSYLKGFDVCLMPFLINETTIHGDHLKLYEYMAAGKPIVSTAVPSAQRFKDLVYVSNSYEEFLKNVEAAYQNDHPDLIQKRVDVAKRNSWDVRVAMKSDIILQIIQTKVIRGGFSTGSSLRDKD